MSNINHTAEPWENSVAGVAVAVSLDEQGRRKTEFIVHCTSTTAPNKENAERIVACVNALEGIKNPAAVKDVIVAANDLLNFAPDSSQILLEALAALDKEPTDA